MYKKSLFALIIVIVLTIFLDIGGVISISALLISLNINSGAVIAIFTVLYVGGTFLMWHEMRKTRLASDEPRLQISLIPKKLMGQDLVYLSIENVGNVPIKDLELDFGREDLKNTYGRSLQEIFKKPIDVLGKNREIKILLYRREDIAKASTITVFAKYKSIFDNKMTRHDTYILDTADLKVHDIAYEPGFEELIRSLHLIEMNLMHSPKHSDFEEMNRHLREIANTLGKKPYNHF